MAHPRSRLSPRPLGGALWCAALTLAATLASGARLDADEPPKVAPLNGAPLKGAPQDDVQVGEKQAEKQLESWIQELGSRKFVVRESAYQNLRTAGSRTIAPLERVLRGNPSAEVTGRCLELLYWFALQEDEAARNGAADVLHKIAVGETSAARKAQTQLARVAIVREREATSRLAQLGLKMSQMGTRVLSIEFNEQWLGKTEDLADLRWLTHVEWIQIECKHASDAWIPYFRDMSNLNTFIVKRSPITDEGVRQLAALKTRISNLDLRYLTLSDKSAEYLSKIESLAQVKLYGTGISVDAVDQMRKSLGLALIDHRDGAFLGVACTGHPLGCEITLVNPGSAAQRCGILGGDVFTRYRDVKVGNFEDLTRLISRNQVGDKVEIELARDVEMVEYNVDLTTEAPHGLTGKPHPLGYQVTLIADDSPFEGRLQTGDVLVRLDDAAIDSQKQLEAGIAKAGRQVVVAEVARGGKVLKVTAELGEWD